MSPENEEQLYKFLQATKEAYVEEAMNIDRNMLTGCAQKLEWAAEIARIQERPHMQMARMRIENVPIVPPGAEL